MQYDDVYDELRKDFKSDKPENKVSLSTYFVLLIVLLIPLFVFIFSRKPYSFTSSFDYLPEPVQSPVSGSANLTVFGKNLIVDFLSSYDINGKVVLVKNFNSVSDFSVKISPKDVVLGWGFMGVQDNIDKFVWDNTLDDMVVSASLKPEYTDRMDNIGGNSTYTDKFSNNRLIASDKKIRHLLNKIDEGDNVRIKGYLAHVYLDDGSWQWGPSCMYQNAKGCEVIYVTDVTWLREL